MRVNRSAGIKLFIDRIRGDLLAGTKDVPSDRFRTRRLYKVFWVCPYVQCNQKEIAMLAHFVDCSDQSTDTDHVAAMDGGGHPHSDDLSTGDFLCRTGCSASPFMRSCCWA